METGCLFWGELIGFLNYRTEQEERNAHKCYHVFRDEGRLGEILDDFSFHIQSLSFMSVI